MNPNPWVDERMYSLNPPRGWQPDTNRALARVQSQRSAAKRNRSKLVWASATVLAGGLGSLAFPAPRSAAQRVWAPCVGACQSLFARAVAGSYAGPARIGQPAPDLALPDASGVPIQLSDYRGKVVLLNFWATWCPPCRVEIPWFVDFQQRYGSRGLAVIGISMDQEGWKLVKPYLELKKVNYRVAIGNDSLAQTFGGLASLPETLLIDRGGKVASRHVGIVSRRDYESEIARLLQK